MNTSRYLCSGNNRLRIDQMLRTWDFFERWIHPHS